MRIKCPYCGEREAHEFSYRGDATVVRPDPAAPNASEAFADFVYLRDNPAGVHREHWYHVAGCHSWLVVERDTRSHRILATSLAHGSSAP
ncbi:MAG TPA: sarcosine oxidase subunit delta [Xanthobacteraceae bacterium]